MVFKACGISPAKASNVAFGSVGVTPGDPTEHQRVDISQLPSHSGRDHLRISPSYRLCVPLEKKKAMFIAKKCTV